jgi:hypothetical protein
MSSAGLKNLWFVFLYLSGIFLWGYFFNWGDIPLDFADWSDITAPRLTYLRDSINKGEWPLHMSNKSTVGGVTDRYQSIPDAYLTPQIFLLKFATVGQWVLVNTLLLYSAGYLGLLWLNRRLKLSNLSITILFILFNFNGHILAHLAVGHATWGGYFLLPWFAGLIFNLMDGERGWAWAAETSILLLVILLQGSYHQYIWLLFFLGFLALTGRGVFSTVLRAGLFSFLLAMPRLWPPSLIAGEFESRFHGGFVGLADFWQSLATVQSPGETFTAEAFFKPLGWWEMTHYIGIPGIIFIVLFALWGWIDHPGSGKPYQRLLVPILGMTALSFSSVFALLRQIPFPLFAGERVAARMLSLPLVFLFFIAAGGFQRWLERPGPGSHIKWLAGVILVCLTGFWLWQNLDTWKIISIYPAFPHENFIDWMWTSSNRYDDLLYIRSIQKGLLVCAASLGLLAGFIAVERKRK